METLNPGLFKALTRKYGDVEIVSPGQQAHVTYRPHYGRGKVRLTVDVTGGEYYKVRCRICMDHRPRLWFNYLWGTTDARTKQRLLHLVNCFNEDCVDTRDVQQQLYDSMVAAFRRHRRGARPELPPIVCDPPSSLPTRKITLPRNCLPVRLLGPDHEASQYLEGRQYDVKELWTRWRVRYCARDLDASPKIVNRIIVPVYRRKSSLLEEPAEKKWLLAGWQARYIGESDPDDDIPRYLTATGMSKSSLLYGLPHTIHGTGPIVVVEGVTDVWRLGRDAVATFGKSLSTCQAQQMAALFEGRPIVVAYDADAAEQNRKACLKLRSTRKSIGDDAPVVAVTLRERYGDIGNCTRKLAWRFVERALEKVG